MNNKFVKKALLVETNATYVEIIRNALSQVGYQIKVSDSASEALRLLPSYVPDIIIIDIELPDLNGKDLIVALRSNSYDMPIVLITDQKDTASIIQAYRLGASDIITTPLRENEMMTIIERVTNQAITHKELLIQIKKTDYVNHDLNDRLRELSIIYAINKTFHSLSSEEKIMDFLFNATSKLLKSSTSYHLGLNKNQSFILKHGIGLEDLPMARLNHEWQDGLGVLVAFSKEPLIVDEQSLKKYSLSRIGKTALAFPHIIDGELMSVLVFIRKSGENFSQNELEIVELILELASFAIKNTRFSKMMKQKNHDIHYLESSFYQLEKQVLIATKNIDEVIKPNLAQNHILLFELKTTPDIDQEVITTMIKNLDEIEENLKSCSTVQKKIDSIETLEICLNTLLDKLLAPYSNDEIQSSYEGETNLYFSSNYGKTEALLNELIQISLSHRSQKPLIVKLNAKNPRFVKISFINQNNKIDYETMFMLLNPLFEKDILDLPSESEIKAKNENISSKQIINIKHGLIWAEKTPQTGNSIHITIPLVVDSFSKSSKDHS